MYGTVCRSAVSQNETSPRSEARYTPSGTANATRIVLVERRRGLKSVKLRSTMDRSLSKRVVVAESFAEQGLAILRDAGITVESMVGRSRDDLKASLETADGLIVRSETRVDRDLLAAGPHLTVVARAGRRRRLDRRSGRHGCRGRRAEHAGCEHALGGRAHLRLDDLARAAHSAGRAVAARRAAGTASSWSERNSPERRSASSGSAVSAATSPRAPALSECTCKRTIRTSPPRAPTSSIRSSSTSRRCCARPTSSRCTCRSTARRAA